MHSNRLTLLERLQIIFGLARIVDEPIGALRPHLQSTVEIRSPKDHAWRPLGTLTEHPVAGKYSAIVGMSPHPKALSEDVNRAAQHFADAA